MEVFKKGDFIYSPNKKTFGIFKSYKDNLYINLYMYANNNNELIFNNCIIKGDWRIACKDEIYEFIKELTEFYLAANPTTKEYLTDSTYYEIGDWFAHHMNLKFDEKLGYDEFLYKIRELIWDNITECDNMIYFKTFDKVLVKNSMRPYNALDNYWTPTFFNRRKGKYFIDINNVIWKECIPYNEKTKYLQGTNDTYK